ncbi:MAG: glycoside hydrolase family 99-like domain-containing protein [Opitutaceae bacterium]|jgi:hypothetical protein|nr:glycoside hydrolase family 99-like domain-containing protein [Opitutaceae bacterium]
MNTRPQIAAYYFPNYHVDPRNERIHGPGWTEWEVVKCARPRFPGHRQPKVPLDGYEDEADPAVMARKIARAADHGIDAFIFDWYYYNDGPFLQRALDEGFLNAPNHDRLKFALMWANHTWRDIHPAKERKRDLWATARPLFPGEVTHETFDRVADLCIHRYFPHPSYWRLDGRPYFSIYDVETLIAGLGGTENTRRALERFRIKTRAAGLPDPHLNAIVMRSGSRLHAEIATAAVLGFDCLASYSMIHPYCAKPDDFPEVDYATVLHAYFDAWDDIMKRSPIPCFPSLMTGCDSSPRTVQSDIWGDLGYPYMYCIKNNTPDAFHEALRAVREKFPSPPPPLFINAWNEWTEGTCLEPDTVNGTAFLEAIRDVFPPAQ